MRNCSYLEDVGQVSEVEDVVEFDGCGQEGGIDLSVSGQGSCHQGRSKLLE